MKVYTLVESEGLIPEAVTFASAEQRDGYLRKRLSEAVNGVEVFVAPTAEGSFVEEPEGMTDEETIEWLLGFDVIFDGDGTEYRRSEEDLGDSPVEAAARAVVEAFGKSGPIDDEHLAAVDRLAEVMRTT